MISYEFQITNKNGDTITLNDHTNPNSVFALQDYPRFTRNIKNNEMERVGQNNFWDFYSYNGKMSLAFSGVIVASTHQELEQKKMLMLKVFAIPIQSTSAKDGYVTVSWTDDDGIAKTVEAKLYQDITFDRRLQQRTTMDFQIQLKLKKNYISKQSGYSSTLSAPRGYFSSGFLLSTLLPVSMTSGYTNMVSITLTSAGALPKIRLYGEDQQPLINPRVLNVDTGEVCQLNMTLVGQAQWVEINTEDGTILNESGIDVSGYLDLSSGFLSLSSGLNRLVYLADPDPITSGILPEAGNHIDVSYKEIYSS